jgi:hypothetical protein
LIKEKTLIYNRFTIHYGVFIKYIKPCQFNSLSSVSPMLLLLLLKWYGYGSSVLKGMSG